MKKQDKPLVTVVIPCYNRVIWLEDEINSLKNQTYPNIEILLVDGGSTDGSVELAKKLGARVIRVNINGFDEARLRYEGAIKAKGSIIIQADSDVHFPKNYVEEMVKPIIKGEADATAISLIKVHKKRKGLLADFWRIKRLASHEAKKRGLHEVKGALAMKKEVIEKVGPYDDSLIVGTDVDYSYRIRKAGFKVKPVFTTWFHHADPDKLIPFIRRVYWGSYYGHEFMKKWKKGYVKRCVLSVFLNSLFFVGLILLPLFPLIGFYSLVPIVLSFLIEGVFPLLFYKHYRLMPKLALKEKKVKLFLLLPFLMYLYMRFDILGWGLGLFRQS